MEHLIVSSQHYLIAGIYRPPDKADLNDKFKDILEKIWIKQKKHYFAWRSKFRLTFQGEPTESNILRETLTESY